MPSDAIGTLTRADDGMPADLTRELEREAARAARDAMRRRRNACTTELLASVDVDERYGLLLFVLFGSVEFDRLNRSAASAADHVPARDASASRESTGDLLASEGRRVSRGSVAPAPREVAR